MNRKYRAWYTHEFFEADLEQVQEWAENVGVKFEDLTNPTPKELAKVYERTFEEMSDPWEVTANGECKVEEVNKSYNDALKTVLDCAREYLQSCVPVEADEGLKTEIREAIDIVSHG